MILREIFLKTNENGELIIGKHILIQMGIGKGEQIYIAYLCPSEEDRKNESREFILTKEGIENLQQDVELEEEVALTIPNVLLIDAEIPLDADLDVICKKGRILIQQVESAEMIIPKEVLEACSEVGIDSENIRQSLQTEVIIPITDKIP